MNNSVILKGFSLLQQDIDEIRTEFGSMDISLASYNATNFISSDVLGILIIQFAQSISFSAAYDMLKYILLVVMTKMSNLKTNANQTYISIELNNKTSKVAFSFDLTDEQKDKLIDVVAQKLLNDNPYES